MPRIRVNQDPGMMPEPDEFLWFGDFSPSEASRLVEAFDKDGIPYRLHSDDSALVNMSAAEAATGGPHGGGVMVRVQILSGDTERATALCNSLFGEPQV